MTEEHRNVINYLTNDITEAGNNMAIHIGFQVHGALKACEERTIDRVLEIIDMVNDDLDFGTKEKGVALLIKEKVLALKGGQSK